VEPGKHIDRLKVRARIDHRDRKPLNRGLRYAMLWLSAVATIAATFGRRLRVVARSLENMTGLASALCVD